MKITQRNPDAKIAEPSDIHLYDSICIGCRPCKFHLKFRRSYAVRMGYAISAIHERHILNKKKRIVNFRQMTGHHRIRNSFVSIQIQYQVHGFILIRAHFQLSRVKQHALQALLTQLLKSCCCSYMHPALVSSHCRRVAIHSESMHILARVKSCHFKIIQVTRWFKSVLRIVLN